MCWVALGGKSHGIAVCAVKMMLFQMQRTFVPFRMENGVLGNALEGVQVEEEGEKAENDSVLPTVDGM